ncbi:hypothetical protein ACU045_12215 [Microbacterium sp. MAHUQ-60]|uniref:hypothetical protein n=1 Tax=unclassified Microbacterium TaxID=2609290 RepID=UPI00361EB71A
MVYRLEPSAFGPDLDPAASIMTAIDLSLPTIDWDTPQRVDGITPEQRRITIVSYPVTGPSAPLTWIPRQRQIGMPPALFGLSGGAVAVVCTGHALSEDTIATATARARRHIETEQAHQATELQTWRDDTARRIRDAVNARRELISTLL